MNDTKLAREHTGRAGTRRILLVALLIGAMMAALLPASSLAPASAEEHGYPDLSAENVHYDNVLRLSADGVLQGFPDGTFRPFQSVTRAQLATYLAGTAGLEEAGPPYEFTDIDDNVHAGNIQALFEAGVISGFPDGTYRPSLPVQRDQAASLIARWLDVAPSGDGPFADVTAGVHEGNVNALYEIGVVNGTTADTYSPVAPLRRDQAASVVVRAIDVLDEVDLILSVLHINDGESALLPDEGAGFPGVARFAADLISLQGEAEDDSGSRAAVTISAGDNFLAGPRLNASLEDPEEFYDAYVYTHTGFDAMTIGNHEFDFGPDVLVDFIEASGDIPFISANLDVSEEPGLAQLEADGRLAASTVVTKGDHDIGIVGATYEGLESISSPRNASTGPVLEAVQDEVDRLTAEGVGIIILSSHLQNLDTEIALAPALSNVDAIVGGGGGEALGDDYPVRVSDADGQTVPVVTVPGNYTDVGRLVLHLDVDGDLVYIGAGSGLIPVPLDGPRDPFIAETVEAPVAAFVAELAEAVIGTTEVPLDGRRGEDTRGVRSRETNLGSLLADAMIYSARERADEYGVPEADVALQNGGGIRNDGVIPVGELTELDTFNVAAFVNIVSVMEMDGTTLHSALERSVSSLPGASGAHGQWGGVRFTYDTDQPAQTRDLDAGVVLTEGERIVDAVVTRADGTEVVLVDDGALVAGDEMFTMSSIDFLLSGQDGYVMFGDLDFTRVGITYQGSLSEYIGHLGTVTAADYPDVTVDNDTYTRFGPVGEFTVN